MSPSLPRTVLVTGGAGFIGRAVVSALLAREGTRVVVVDDLSKGDGPERQVEPQGARLLRMTADVRDRGCLRELLRAGPPTGAIVHLAARVGVRTVLADPEGAARANLDGVQSLIDVLRSLPEPRRPRVFAASSSEVYAESSAPLSEASALRSERDGRWAYAAAKLAGEALLDHAAELWPRERAPLHLRFFNVVGPGQDAESGMVLPRFIEAARSGAPLTVHGDGLQVRTFAHVEDVARDVAALVLGDVLPTPDGVSGGPLNLGGDARTTMLALAELVAARAAHAGLGRSTVRHVDPLRDVGSNFRDVRHRVPDLGRARALGLAAASRSLVQIVDDALQRHRSGASPSALEREPLVSAAAVNQP